MLSTLPSETRGWTDFEMFTSMFTQIAGRLIFSSKLTPHALFCLPSSFLALPLFHGTCDSCHTASGELFFLWTQEAVSSYVWSRSHYRTQITMSSQKWRYWQVGSVERVEHSTGILSLATQSSARSLCWDSPASGGSLEGLCRATSLQCSNQWLGYRTWSYTRRVCRWH